MKAVLTLILIMLLTCLHLSTYAQNTVATHKTVVATPTVTLKLEGKVQVVEAKGSRIIVETYVSTNGGTVATQQVANTATPIATVVNENNTVISQGKQFIVNNHNASVSYKVFIPKGTTVN
jgi:hypothetical protein